MNNKSELELELEALLQIIQDKADDYKELATRFREDEGDFQRCLDTQNTVIELLTVAQSIAKLLSRNAAREVLHDHLTGL